MLLLSVYETFLYYCCLLLISYYILNCTPKKFYLYGSFIAFIPLVLIAISGNNTFHNIAYIVFVIAQFLLLKIIFRNSSITGLIFSYILIDSINILLVTPATAYIPCNRLFTEFILVTLTSALCVFLCIAKIRFKIQQFVEWVPRYVLLVLSFLLISSSLLSVLISGSPEAVNPDIWGQIMDFALTFLLLSLCIVFPVLLLNAISNNHLKSLTTNYEQQIEAQAKYYKELASANYESRRFKHDFNNTRIAIEKLLADGKSEQALNLIQECSEALKNPVGFQASFDTGNGIADALLTDKQQKASLCNAAIHFQGALPQDALLPTDVCVILGNTLDNAIEACQKLPLEKEKDISITCSCNSGFLFLTICNPVAEKVLIENNHVVTTKENKTLHGFGLYSLQSVVKKYTGEVHLQSTKDSFTVSIDLCIMLPQGTTSAL